MHLKAKYPMMTVIAVSAVLSACSAKPAVKINTDETVPKQMMMPAPATYSDSVTPGIGILPYWAETHDIETRDIGVSFDEYPDTQKILHTVHFKTGSAKISKREKNALEARMAGRTTPVKVIGYADPRGGTRYNQTLSEKRMEAVRHQLKEMNVQTERGCAFGENRLPSEKNCGDGHYE